MTCIYYKTYLYLLAFTDPADFIYYSKTTNICFTLVQTVCIHNAALVSECNIEISARHWQTE